MPYLNDEFASYLNVKHINILFGELVNYLDIFDQFEKHINSKKLLKEYFHLEDNTIYLALTEYFPEYGCGEDNTFFIQTNTGKGKITSAEYLKYIKILNPEYAVIPFEYIPSDCGKKRVVRCYKKIKDFFNMVKLNKEEYIDQNFIIPYYPIHKQHININEIKDLLSISKGMVVITEDCTQLSYAAIKDYQASIASFAVEMKIKSSTNTPLDILLGYMLGCNYFEINFPFIYSEKGHSLSIDFDRYSPKTSYGKFEEMKDFGYEPKVLDLNDLKYENDLDTLNTNCKCFTCTTNYKRAYIHHLMKCKELNGNILLTIHNVYQTKELYDRYTSLKTNEEKENYCLWYISTQCNSIK